MKKLILAFLLLSLQIVVFGQSDKIWLNEDWEIVEGESDASYFRFIRNMENGSYKFIDYYISGELQYVGAAQNKQEPFLQEGFVAWYYKNGAIQTSCKYEAGVKQGKYTNYFPDGSVMEHYSFVMDKPVLPYYEYYGNGQIRAIGELNNGIETWKRYHPNGILYEQYSSLNGLNEGLMMRTNYEGDTLAYGHFDQDQVQDYYFNRTFSGIDYVQSCTWNDALQQEEWKLFKNNTLYRTFFVKDEQLVGSFTQYFPNGEIEKFSNFSASCYDPIIYERTSILPDRFLKPVLAEPSEIFEGRGGLDGKVEYFTTDGEVVYKAIYKCGSLEKIRKDYYVGEEEVDYNIPYFVEAPNCESLFQNEEFLTKNNCQIIDEKTKLSVCSLETYSTTIRLFQAPDFKDLRKYSKTVEVDKNEMVIFYSYDTNTSTEYTYQMKISLGDNLAVSLNNKIIPYRELSHYIYFDVFEATCLNRDQLDGMIQDIFLNYE